MIADVRERFWAKTSENPETGCWEWTAAKSAGYGCFWDGTRMVRAHRFAYELLVGPIPDGLILDHLCRNHGCVKPTHLEPVTNAENLRRGLVGEHLKNSDTCRNGLHPWPESARLCSDGAHRCDPCQRIAFKRSDEKKKKAKLT